MAALRMALKRIEEQNVSLIHHFDRGCQYAGHVYTATLKSHGTAISMTESGDPMDNRADRAHKTTR